MLEKWKKNLGRRSFVLELVITIIVLILTLSGLANFLNQIELRQGVILSDPLLGMFKPMDLTYVIFSVLYIGLIVGIIFLIKDPERLLIGIQAYIIMIIFRMAAMYLVPLDPPSLMIPLSDPFVQFFGTGKLLTRDLFFSGHTSTLFLLFLISEVKWLKVIFLCLTLIVAGCVIAQHVHYTIDVFVAPFFSYASYRIALSMHK